MNIIITIATAEEVVCIPVCVSVCLCAKYVKKLRTNFDEIFVGVPGAWAKNQLLDFGNNPDLDPDPGSWIRNQEFKKKILRQIFKGGPKTVD